MDMQGRAVTGHWVQAPTHGDDMWRGGSCKGFCAQDACAARHQCHTPLPGCSFAARHKEPAVPLIVGAVTHLPEAILTCNPGTSSCTAYQRYNTSTSMPQEEAICLMQRTAALQQLITPHYYLVAYPGLHFHLLTNINWNNNWLATVWAVSIFDMPLKGCLNLFNITYNQHCKQTLWCKLAIITPGYTMGTPLCLLLATAITDINRVG